MLQLCKSESRMGTPEAAVGSSCKIAVPMTVSMRVFSREAGTPDLKLAKKNQMPASATPHRHGMDGHQLVASGASYNSGSQGYDVSCAHSSREQQDAGKLQRIPIQQTFNRHTGRNERRLRRHLHSYHIHHDHHTYVDTYCACTYCAYIRTACKWKLTGAAQSELASRIPWRMLSALGAAWAAACRCSCASC